MTSIKLFSTNETFIINDELYDKMREGHGNPENLINAFIESLKNVSNKKLKRDYNLLEGEIKMISDVKSFYFNVKKDKQVFLKGTTRMMKNPIWCLIALITHEEKEEQTSKQQDDNSSKQHKERKKKTSITKDIVIRTKILINDGVKHVDISKMLDISNSSVSRIHNGVFDNLLSEEEKITLSNIDNNTLDNKADDQQQYEIDNDENYIIGKMDLSYLHTFSVNKKLHVCGLVANRHNIKYTKQYIFKEALPDSSKINFDKLKETVRDYFKENKIDNTYKVVMYATGLQSAIMAVAAVCYDNDIELIVMHYSPITREYYAQAVNGNNTPAFKITADESYSIEKDLNINNEKIIFESVLKIQRDSKIIYRQSVYSNSWNEILDMYLKMVKHITCSEAYSMVQLYKYEKPDGSECFKNRSHLSTADNFLYYSKRSTLDE